MDKIYSYILSQIPETIDFDFISVKNETIKPIYLENIAEQSIRKLNMKWKHLKLAKLKKKI